MDSQTVETRWGHYEVLKEFYNGANEVKVKILHIEEGENLSLQYHEHRKEDWHVLSGVGLLVKGHSITYVTVGDKFEIPKLAQHSVRAVTNMIILEVQEGSKCSEDDIERIEMDWDAIVERVAKPWK